MGHSLNPNHHSRVRSQRGRYTFTLMYGFLEITLMVNLWESKMNHDHVCGYVPRCSIAKTPRIHSDMVTLCDITIMVSHD